MHTFRYIHIPIFVCFTIPKINFASCSTEDSLALLLIMSSLSPYTKPEYWNIFKYYKLTYF